MHHIRRIEGVCPNTVSRGGIVPFVIVNIEAGRFPEPAHYTISAEGRTEQHLDLEQTALFDWNAPGCDSLSCSAVVTDHMETHPGLFSVFISYEAAADGLTREQLEASVWLHRHIRHTIAQTYGRWFPLSSYHVISMGESGPGTGEDGRLSFQDLYPALCQADEDFALADTIAAIETLSKEGYV